MASNRELRGFDLWRLGSVLGAVTLPTLRDVLIEAGDRSTGSKDDVLGRIQDLVENGDVTVRSILSGAPKSELRRACRHLDLDDAGTVQEIIDRIDRAVRYAALGDAHKVPPDVVARIDPSLTDRERLFVLELHARLARRAGGASRFSVGEIVGRLGRRRAQFRARAAAICEAATTLWDNGIATDPDLRSIERSPGIDAVVVVGVRDGWDSTAQPSEDRDQARGEGATANIVAARAPDDGLRSAGIAHRGEPPMHAAAVSLSIAELGMTVSKSDEIIRESEIAKIMARMEHDRGVATPTERAQLSALVQLLRDARIDIAQAAKRIAERLDVAQRSSILAYLFEVAMADGVIVPQEETVLRWMNYALRPEPGLFDRLMAEYRACATTTPPSSRPSPAGEAPESTRARFAASPDTDRVRVPDLPLPSSEWAAQASTHVDEIMALLFVE